MLLVIGVFAQNRVSERRFVLGNNAQVTRDCLFSSQIGVSESAYTHHNLHFPAPADCVYSSQTLVFEKTLSTVHSSPEHMGSLTKCVLGYPKIRG